MPHEKKPKRKLKDLRIGKIAFVDTPAVQGSVFVVAKAEDAQVADEPKSDTVSHLTETKDESPEIRKELAELKETVSVLAEAVKSLTKSREEPVEKESPAPPPKKANPRLAALAASVSKMANNGKSVLNDYRLSTGKLEENEDG